MAHPSDRIRGHASDHLAGKRIVLGIAGSIAAVKTVELARELIRHGADVLPVMTPAAAKIIGPDSLEFATGHKPIMTLTGQVEHVRAFGAEAEADLMLVAPATANTIAKMALGIDDTALTTFATVALGAARPVMVAPAMHAPMEENPPTQRHIQTLRDHGVTFIRPLYEEGKAKLAPIDEIVAECTRVLGPQTLAGQRVLVVTGAAREPLDPARVITNRSSGRMGRAIARAAHRLGAELTIVTTPDDGPWPPGADIHHYEDVPFLLGTFDTHLAELAPDWVLVPAALSDFAPRPSSTKLSSDNDTINVRLDRLPKALPKIREILPTARIIGWKLQDTLDEAITAARERLTRYGCDAIIANGADAMDADRATVALVAKDSTLPIEGTKDDIANMVFDELAATTQNRAKRSIPAEGTR